MKKLSRTHIYLIISSTIFVVLAGLYVYALSSLEEIKNERNAITAELKAETNVAGDADTESIRNYMIPKDELALFVSYIESECTRFELSCVTQSLEESVPNPDIASIQIFKMNFQTKGSFSSTTSFLSSFEKSRYLITVHSADMQAGEGWIGNFTISVPVVPR